MGCIDNEQTAPAWEEAIQERISYGMGTIPYWGEGHDYYRDIASDYGNYL